MGLEAPESVAVQAESDSQIVQDEIKGCWRQDNTLVILPTAVLPHRCIKCNRPAQEPIKPLKLVYREEDFQSYFLHGLIAGSRSKSIIISPGLCAAHKQRRLIGLFVGIVGTLLGLALMTNFVVKGSVAVIAGIVVTLGSILGWYILSRVVTVKEMNDHYIRLGGCGKAFLDSLPQIKVYINTK